MQIGDLWVIIGKLDLPVYLPSTADEAGKDHRAVRLMLDFSGGDGDGYIELRPDNIDRASEAQWWSEDEPSLFHFRASVIAFSLTSALSKSNDFLEQALDRITFIAGVPAKLVSKDLLYNETQLEACREGKRATVDCTAPGRLTYQTVPLANPHISSPLSPRAKMALRWFRKSLVSLSPEDRFLGFYIALEAISDDLQPPREIEHTCHKCGTKIRKQTVHSEGIKDLITQRGLPAETFDTLRDGRGRIAHGGADVSTLRNAERFVPLTQQLAQDGIARSLGVDPTSIRMAAATPPNVVPILVMSYDPKDNPHSDWGTSICESLSKLLRARGKPVAQPEKQDQPEGEVGKPDNRA